MIGAKVDVGRRFGDELRRRANLVARDAVADASRAGAEAASAIAARRRRTGTMADMELLDVEGTANGWSGGFRSKAWYAHFQSRGTRRGIQPLGFLEEGRKVGRRELVRELERRLR